MPNVQSTLRPDPQGARAALRGRGRSLPVRVPLVGTTPLGQNQVVLAPYYLVPSVWRDCVVVLYRDVLYNLGVKTGVAPDVNTLWSRRDRTKLGEKRTHVFRFRHHHFVSPKAGRMAVEGPIEEKLARDELSNAILCFFLSPMADKLGRAIRAKVHLFEKTQSRVRFNLAAPRVLGLFEQISGDDLRAFMMILC